MGAVLDLIIVCIITVTVFLSAKRGFVKTALGSLGVVIALSVALIFSSTLSAKLQGGFVGDTVRPAVNGIIDSVVSERSVESDEDDSDGTLKRLCSVFGAESKGEKLQKECDALKDKGVEAVRDKVKETLTESGVALFCKILAFLLLFLGTRAAVKLAEIVLDKIVELPILKKANRLLGALIGLIPALFRTYLFCLIMRLLLPLLGDFGVKAAASDSVLYGFFCRGISFIPGL